MDPMTNPRGRRKQPITNSGSSEAVVVVVPYPPLPPGQKEQFSSLLFKNRAQNNCIIRTGKMSNVVQSTKKM
jgi:hypothetical protein